ncbi:MAG: hypoxanthine phosphoribosyltransferase [Alistipes sp.]|jgi:hypoxanthine phosphoribosyltransferase|nr:hypoxanthine phosphoribosyltransferase [Alistipes sp.]
MNKVKLHDRTFRVMIPAAEIDMAIDRVAARINEDYAGRETPLFLGVLNGAFMFMAELMKKMECNCELSFVKLSSYCGTGSTGKVSELIGLKNNIEGRHVIIVEDIVDTGESMEHLLRSLAGHRPASVEIATLFFKPDSFRKDFEVKYKALDIGNEFIVGFGLDYDELGRNLKDIYVIDEE